MLRAVWRFGYRHVRALHQEPAVEDPLERGAGLRASSFRGAREAGLQRSLTGEDVEEGQGVGALRSGHDEYHPFTRGCSLAGATRLTSIGWGERSFVPHRGLAAYLEPQM